MMHFPDGSEVEKKKKKNLPANAGDTGDVSLIPGLGRFPGEGNGNPLQYSCLGNPMDRAWRATVHGVTRESHTTSRWTTATGDRRHKGLVFNAIEWLHHPLTAQWVSCLLRQLKPLLV